MRVDNIGGNDSDNDKFDKAQAQNNTQIPFTSLAVQRATKSIWSSFGVAAAVTGVLQTVIT